MSAGVLTFEPVAHEYRFDGAVIPSVTQILRDVGVSVDFETLSSMSQKIGAAIELKREIGTVLHTDAHAFDDDDLDWGTVDPRVFPYLESWAAFRANSGLLPITRERQIFHPVFRYAGTLDGIFKKPNGGFVLIDIKTGDPDASGCRFQTAAYLSAYVHNAPDLEALAIERWGVQLTPGMKVPYRVTPYFAWDDFLKFQAFLTTYHHQASRRRSA